MCRAWDACGLPRRGRNLDLWEANAGQLTAAGLQPGRIAISGICTLSDPRFFSYRRGDGNARNMAVLSL
jgi:copper oxidase (laccase) domain-containing protein